MNYSELFNVIKLRCPKCNSTQNFYVGSYIKTFQDDFSKEERTCENCNQFVWDSDLYTVLTGEWTNEEIVEAISGEFENQNKHSQTSYPLKLLRTLRGEGIPEHTIKDILTEFFQDVLD